MFAKYWNLVGLSEEIEGFIQQWSDGNRVISALVLREAQNVKQHITAESSMLKDQIITNSEASSVHIDVQHWETRDHVTSESSRIIEHFDTGRRAESPRREREDLKTRILSTLWFPEVNARKREIRRYLGCVIF